MNIVLVNIYPLNTFSWYLLSSYGLKAYVEGHNTGLDDFNIKVLNFSNISSGLKILKSIRSYSPDIVGFSCYCWNIKKVFEVINMAREIPEHESIGIPDSESKVIHVCGGPEISLKMIKELENPNLVDYYIIGEGEKSFLSLVNSLYYKKNNNFIKNLSGIAIWDEQRKSLHYKENEEQLNLDDVPSVYLNGTIDERLYQGGQVYIETQRGCKFKCKYCLYHKNLPKVRYFQLEHVYKEIDFLVMQKKVLAIRFLDAIFTSDLARAKSIVRHLLSIKSSATKLPNIYWEYEYNTIDEEFLKMVAQLRNSKENKILNKMELLDKPQIYDELVDNYTVVNCIGVQSFNNDSLKAIGRATINKSKFSKFMTLCHKLNLLLKLDIILGLPNETLVSYLKGIEVILEYCKGTEHILNIHVLQLLPGTQLYENNSQFKFEFYRDSPHIVYSTDSMDSEEISYAAKLSALLFRIINSPLRGLFYKAQSEIKCNYIDLLEVIYDQVLKSGEFDNTEFIKSKMIHDEYWNKKIYQELPSSWLKKLLGQPRLHRRAT